MKNLKEFIKEGLFDDIDNIENTNGLDNATKGFEQLDKEKIIDWICEHYFLTTNDFRTIAPLNKSQLKIDFKTDPPTVNHRGSLGVKHDMSSLTNNGMFQWGKVSGEFRCANLKSLMSLEGAPKEVEGNFDCYNCESLKTLEGAPKKVSGNFDCGGCISLKTLEGAPKKVGEGFYCYYCKSLTSLKGAPKKIDGNFDCSCCKSLKSLKDASKEVGGDFSCYNCGTQFTETDVKKVSNIKKGIFCRQW